MNVFKFFLMLLAVLFTRHVISQVFPGADEETPSRSQYFSWINHTNEGPTAQQTKANMDFFQWLHDEYGMELDIYAFDAGTVDGRNSYGTMNSVRFERQFPTGFEDVKSWASGFGARLGLWGGPDGFGETEEQAQARIDMMVSLCRDFDFALFKFDAVCGILRPEKQDEFVRMMSTCRKYAPDLILLNHRLDLGEEGKKHATTFLLGGSETYIDVHIANEQTGPHHRVGALRRSPPENLIRLTEDHGICLSSCLDYWEDDLILQAFNRNLILAPQIYGNPWLLCDDEFPKLARIFNLHRKHREILSHGILIPEKYGQDAVSRGDDTKRFITLKNLGWKTRSTYLTIGKELGLGKRADGYFVKQYHPTERLLAFKDFGDSVLIEIPPFRSSLIGIYAVNTLDEFTLTGIDYEVVQDIPGKALKVLLIGRPGEKKSFSLMNIKGFQRVKIGKEDYQNIMSKKNWSVQFEGVRLSVPVHRFLGEMNEIPVLEEAESLYEATQFSVDNNSLEARSLARSGPTGIRQVKKSREAFFNQQSFLERETWDRYLFDGNLDTQFSINMRYKPFNPYQAAFRIDKGTNETLDSLIIYVSDHFALQPYRSEEGEYFKISSDLSEWRSLIFQAKQKMVIDFTQETAFRYIRFPYSFLRVSEIEAYKNGSPVDQSGWSASNLQRPYVSWHWDTTQLYTAKKAWSLKFKLKEINEGSYLCMAVNGKHGVDGVVGALKVGEKYIGSPDRAPSHPSNTWEYRVMERDSNYTFFFPLNSDWEAKEVEAVLLGFNNNMTIKPEMWITHQPKPLASIEVLFERE